MTNFIRQQLQMAQEQFEDEDGAMRIDKWDSTALDTLTKQIITNTVNHLLSGVEDMLHESPTDGLDEATDNYVFGQMEGYNQANTKIRQRCKEIISEVSEIEPKQ